MVPYGGVVACVDERVRIDWGGLKKVMGTLRWMTQDTCGRDGIIRLRLWG